jgi:hypothetical protein
LRGGCVNAMATRPKVDILILLALPFPAAADRLLRPSARRAHSAAHSKARHSIRFGQTEHALRDVAENEVRADRGDARDQNLPQAALDVIEMTPIDRLPKPVSARIRHQGLSQGRRATLIFRLAPSAARSNHC